MTSSRVRHRLSMLDGPDEHTPPFCECGNWWPCPKAGPQPLEPWERELADAIFRDDADEQDDWTNREGMPEFNGAFR